MSRILLFLFLLAALPVLARTPKGHLFIVGGGERSDSLWSHFVELGGGKKCKALIVPYAASENLAVVEQTGREQAAELRRIGCDADYIAVPKKDIDSPEALAKLKGVTAIFFSGGIQSRLTRLFPGSRFFDRICKIYEKGGVVGGTSAGAAVQSKIMLTGGENSQDNPKKKFTSIKNGHIVTLDGFGFVDKFIIDQHFIIRKRENRLISILLENNRKAVGIDESTAIIVNPDDTFKVVGLSQVMIFEPNVEGTVSSDSHQGVKSLTIRLLTAGDVYKF